MSHDPFDLEQRTLTDAEASERAKLAAKAAEDDLKWLMGNKRGRRFMRVMLERAGVHQLSFNTNAMQMSFNEGRRNEGLAQLVSIMRWCPDAYIQMMKESEDV